MASKARFNCNVGTKYFLELRDKLMLTTRSEKNPHVPSDNDLIQLHVYPDNKLSEAVGYGMFYVEVVYPRGKDSVFIQRFPMVAPLQQDIYEESRVTALVSIDIGATYVTFEIDTVVTF